MDILESAKSNRKRMGRKFLIKHLEGKRLTKQQAIRAKCYECDGIGEYGECSLSECPLYPYSFSLWECMWKPWEKKLRNRYS